MNTRLLTLLSLVIVACGSPCGSFGSETSELESALRQLRSRDLTVENLGAIYKLREYAPNADIHAKVLRACGAGLLYLGQQESYNHALRHSIPEVTLFERSLLASCSDCRGAGETASLCTTCRGDGKCKGVSCQGGQARREGFDGKVAYRRCPVCVGTGKCKNCSGTGRVSQRCHKCAGRGGIFSTSVALSKCREQIEAAVAAFEAIKVAEAERLAKAEYESRRQEIELSTKREAILIEAKVTGEERARQAAIAAREEAERERKAAEDAQYTEVDKDYLKSIVLIEGDRGTGTGFLCEFKGKQVLFSNAHVLFGNRSLRLRTIAGQDLTYAKILVCKDRDIVAYELGNPSSLSWLNIHDRMDNINNQESVVVFGNSAGGGVVTTLRGKMQGIGPDKVEVDATFVQGNSGSPIIAYPYNAVIGMATYATQEPQVDWAKRSTRFADVRRFGVRIDNVDWSDFFVLDGQEYTTALDVFDDIIAFAENEVMKAKWQGAYYRATGNVKARAEALLNKYRATPQWMRQFADEAALAANVCTLILK